MKTQELETVSTRVAKTLKEVVNDREIFYQYETDDNTPNPLNVNFSTQGENGNGIGGTYSANGGISINGSGIMQEEDLAIVNIAFKTILKIIKNQ